ncbi:MAG: uroporphyrinogen-III C-methyltransferase [Myxococcota bacterium]
MPRASNTEGRGAGGFVSLVGAGPGDPGLVTVRAAQCLREADLVLYDELVSSAVLALVGRDTEVHNVGKRGHEEPVRSQEAIEEWIVDAARSGQRVVRLKGGDPFVFGRGGEEASACARAGIPFEVVPGVSSALAAPAYAGIPVTDRRHSASFAVVTGHKDPTEVSEATRWASLVQTVDTLVILMGMRNLADLVARMIAGGADPATPAAAVSDGTLPSQRVVEAALADLPDAVRAARLRAPAAVVVGHVVALREELAWFEPGRLAGVRVLVTRAREQGAELEADLRAAGAQPISIPMVAFAPVLDQAAVDRGLAELERFDAVLFSSANAVRFLAARARETGTFEKLADGRLEIGCMGVATADAVHREGLRVHFVGRGGARELIADLVTRDRIRGRRFFLPRSEIGRDELETQLVAAGGAVETAPLYRNRRPEVDAESLRERLCAGDFDVLCFASPSAASHFASLQDAASKKALTRSVVSALGETTAAALREEGIAVDVTAPRPVLGDWIEAIADHLRDLRERS